MKLPNADLARVERAKIENYLLSHDHPDGATKARLFELFGFRRSMWEVLAAALREHGQVNQVNRTVETGYGMRYIVDGELRTPGGRRPTVRTVWIVESGLEGPRLITAHPIEEPT
jgi:hypothetical protein